MGKDKVTKTLEDIKKDVISKEEQELIGMARANRKRQEDCVNAIQGVLETYSCNLIVDKNSPIGNPAVIVQLLQVKG